MQISEIKRLPLPLTLKIYSHFKKLKIMKKSIIISLLFVAMLSFNVSAQKANSTGSYGNTLNLGLGIGYYGYVDGSVPVFNINYEFDVAKNFTLAPFISFYSYKKYWDNNNYYYRETIIPIGAKGTYYFDQILNANSNWDFYLAGSLGFAIVNTTWDSRYIGDKGFYDKRSPLFLDLHAGAEYHLSNNVGLFLDLSTGVSTIGLAIH